MLLDLWPTLEACWGADWCASQVTPGGGVKAGFKGDYSIPKKKKHRDTDEDALAVLGLL